MNTARRLNNVITALAGLILLGVVCCSKAFSTPEFWLQVFALIGSLNVIVNGGFRAKEVPEDSVWETIGIVALFSGLVLHLNGMPFGYILIVLASAMFFLRQLLDLRKSHSWHHRKYILMMLYLIGICFLLQYQGFLILPFERSSTLKLFDLCLSLVLLYEGICGHKVTTPTPGPVNSEIIDFPGGEDD